VERVGLRLEALVGALTTRLDQTVPTVFPFNPHHTVLLSADESSEVAQLPIALHLDRSFPSATKMDNLAANANAQIGQFPLEQWFYEMPVCTRWWTAATVATSLAVQTQVITPFQLFYSFRAVFVKNQVRAFSLHGILTPRSLIPFCSLI
jgi:Der1-like family